ncbi:MAG: general secretion pathway protein GspB, partial [Burkholderiaceae bacterium]
GRPAAPAGAAATLLPAASPRADARAQGDAPSTLAQGETPAPRPGGLDPAALPIEPPMTRPADGGRPPPDQPAYRPPPSNIAAPRLGSHAAAGRTAPPQTRPAAGLVAPSPAVAKPAPAAAIANVNDLPPAVRADLPRLAVGGAIYSELPSARMVILNGQVFHEGDKPAPDTVLEQIRLKSAVLNFRGQRYELTF